MDKIYFNIHYQIEWMIYNLRIGRALKGDSSNSTGWDLIVD